MKFVHVINPISHFFQFYQKIIKNRNFGRLLLPFFPFYDVLYECAKFNSIWKSLTKVMQGKGAEPAPAVVKWKHALNKNAIGSLH